MKKKKNSLANIFTKKFWTKSRVGQAWKKIAKTFRKNKWLRRSVILAIAVIAMIIYFTGIRSVVKSDVEYVVPSGASITSAARDLKSRGVIESENAFKIIVTVIGGKIHAGIYDIPKGASTFQVAKIFTRGRVATIAITIPEGYTVKQTVAALNKNDFLTGDVCVFDAGAGNECPPDGSLFPNTYHVPKGTERMAVIGMMQKKMNSIKTAWTKSGTRPPRPLKDWNDVITLASIVQKETPKASEMPTVASVYINRLRMGMRLQADPTVVYAITNRLGDMQGRVLWTNDLKRADPYNTYTNYGLPPGPIANVGRDAIAAVLNPADTNYLFFVADGTGGHIFARDFKEHNVNRDRWREIKRTRQESSDL